MPNTDHKTTTDTTKADTTKAANKKDAEVASATKEAVAVSTKEARAADAEKAKETLKAAAAEQAKKEATEKAVAAHAADEATQAVEVLAAAKKVANDNEDKAATPKSKALLTIDAFVEKLLSKHFGKDVVEQWTGPVVAALSKDNIVTVTRAEDSDFPLLEIHSDLYYRHRDSVRSLAARYGDRFIENISQTVSDYYAPTDKKGA